MQPSKSKAELLAEAFAYNTEDVVDPLALSKKLRASDGGRGTNKR